MNRLFVHVLLFVAAMLAAHEYFRARDLEVANKKLIQQLQEMKLKTKTLQTLDTALIEQVMQVH